jgi:type IV pilus assembly protein PilP
MIKNLRNSLILLLATLLMSACGNNEFKDLNEKLAQLKQSAITDKANHAAQLPTPPEPIKYTAQPNQSPFTMTAAAQQQGETKKLSNNPLQSYSLTVLRFVGTVKENGKVVAFIQTPENKIYPVNEGDLIGDQYGKITHIDQDKIDIMEKIAAEGYAKEHLVTLQLKEGTQ